MNIHELTSNNDGMLADFRNPKSCKYVETGISFNVA